MTNRRWTQGAVCSRPLRCLVSIVLAAALLVPAGCISILNAADARPPEENEAHLIGGALDFVVPGLVGAAIGGLGGAAVGVVLGIPIYLLDRDYSHEKFEVGGDDESS